ncbi:hypothetical protein [uncultured Enterococcus sp.]|nr:hypothetical protein [uncultured Enterococcus sp.]
MYKRQVEALQMNVRSNYLDSIGLVISSFTISKNRKNMTFGN